MTEAIGKCIECGSPTPPRKRGTGPARTCSPRCQKAAAYRAMREKYEAELKAKGRVLRTCSRCKSTIAAQSGSWPMSHGAPSGTICGTCFEDRQKGVDERIRAKRRASPPGVLLRVEARARDLQQHASILGPDADVALRLGAEVLNRGAESAANQLAEAIEDPTSEFHREALELFVSRALPMATVSKAAVRLARNGELRSTTEGGAPAADCVVVTVGVTHGPEWKE